MLTLHWLTLRTRQFGSEAVDPWFSLHSIPSGNFRWGFDSRTKRGHGLPIRPRKELGNYERISL